MLSRVFGIRKDGTISLAENKKKGHNALSLELYGPFIKTLTPKQMEISEGAVSTHWPIAGAVVKNRKDLIFLELLGEDIDIPCCVTLVPTTVSSKQILIAKQRYETMKDMHFADETNCNGTEFITHINFKSFEILYEHLNKRREREVADISMEFC